MNYQVFIPVELSGAYEDSQQIVIHVLNLNPDPSSEAVYRFDSQSLFFGPGLPTTQQVQLEIKGSSRVHPPTDIFLVLVQQTGSAILKQSQIKLVLAPIIQEESDLQQATHRIRFSLGANFDFIDGPKLNNPYADVSGFLPFLVHPESGQALRGIHRWGLHLFLYQNRTISSTLNSTIISGEDSLSKSVNHLKQDFLGLQVSPMFRLSGNDPSFRNPFQLYAFLQLEFSQQRLQLQPMNSSIQGLASPSSEESGKEFGSFIPFIGPGILLRYQTKDVDLMIRQSTGYAGGYRFIPDLFTDQYTIPNRAGGPMGYHLTQINLIEKHIGLKLGMEMRGLFQWKSAFSTASFRPSFSVFLAKEVSFSKIGKLFDSIGRL